MDSATSGNGKSSDALAEQTIDRHDAGLSRQVNWRSRWDDAAHFIAQNRRNGILSKTSPGQEQTLGVFDMTASDCANVMAAGMLTQTAPAGELWFLLRPDVNEGDQSELSVWLKSCSDRMARLLGSSNFYEDGFEAFTDAATFNIGAILIDGVEGGADETAGAATDAERVNFIHLPVGTYTIEEDAWGRVGALFRTFEFTADQVRERFGDDAPTEPMRKALNAKNAKERCKKFKILHGIHKRKDGVRKGIVAGRFRPWASIYVCMESRRVILEDGFYEQPFAIFRMMRGNGEIYGRGPSEKAMPVIRELNQIGRAMRTGMNKQIDPPWLLPDASSYNIDNRPGGRIYWDASNQLNRPEQLQIAVDFRWVQDWAEGLRAQLRTAFYTDMFQMLSNPDAMRREKTAYEVSQMMQEKLVLFSPIFGRIVSEFLNPMLQRVFGIMARAKLFDLPPMDGPLDYRIDYVSKIALAIRAAQSGSLMSLANVIASLATFDPSVAMIIDWRKAARDTADSLGVRSDLQRSEEEVERLIQEQQKAAAVAQVEQLAGAAQKGSAAAKNLGPDAQAAAMSALSGGGA